MTNCPVEDCQEIREIKETNRFWLKILVPSVLTFTIAMGAAIFVVMANAREIPRLREAVADHQDRLNVVETRQEAILYNTKEIKRLLEDAWTGQK